MSDSRVSVTGRLAPSPTGLLHLGNAWAFFLAWLACRAQQGKLVLRIEDVDAKRAKPEYITALTQDLQWLGLDWDEGYGKGGAAQPYVQSERLALYAEMVEKLVRKRRVYPCFCSRKELKELSNAPHSEDHGVVYPGTCRGLSLACREQKIACGVPYALRLACEQEQIFFYDACLGSQSFCPADFGGDFPIKRSDGVYSYQLAVAVDDALMGVTQVVRGNDLLISTARQILLLQLLNLPVPKVYLHVPLLVDEQGERLAKRHNALSLRSLRERGVKPWQIIGLLASIANMNPFDETMDVRELISSFDPKVLGDGTRHLTTRLLQKFLS